MVFRYHLDLRGIILLFHVKLVICMDTILISLDRKNGILKTDFKLEW